MSDLANLEKQLFALQSLDAGKRAQKVQSIIGGLDSLIGRNSYAHSRNHRSVQSRNVAHSHQIAKVVCRLLSNISPSVRAQNSIQLCAILSKCCVAQIVNDWSETDLDFVVCCLLSWLQWCVMNHIDSIPLILKTMGHVVFERGSLLQPSTQQRFMDTVLPLVLPCAPSPTDNQFSNVLSALYQSYLNKIYTPPPTNATDEMGRLFFDYNETNIWIAKNQILVSTHSSSDTGDSELNGSGGVTVGVAETKRFIFDIQKMAAVSVGHIISKCNHSGCFPQYYNRTFHCLFGCFKDVYRAYHCRYDVGMVSKVQFTKSVTALIKSITQSYNEIADKDCNAGDKDSIVELIGYLRDLMVFRCDDLLSANNSGVEVEHPTPHRHRNKVFSATEAESDLVSESDSPYTGRDSSNTSFFVPFDVYSKLRISVQQCLLAMLKANKAAPKSRNSSTAANSDIFYDVWPKLLPNTERGALSQRPFTGAHLITVLLYDSHPRVRNAAAVCVQSILDKCPLSKLVGVAVCRTTSDRTKESNTFSTISERAKTTLESIHVGLIHALQHTESQITCRTAIVKCLIIAVNICNYGRLRNGLLTEISQISLTELKTAKQAYKSALLLLLSHLFALKPSANRIVGAPFNNSGDERSAMDELYPFFGATSSPSIMRILLQQIKKQQQSAIGSGGDKNDSMDSIGNSGRGIDVSGDKAAMRSVDQKPMSTRDARIVLSSMARDYRKFLCEWWSRGLRDALITGLGSSQPTAVLETLRMIHNWMTLVPLSPGVTQEDAVMGLFRLPNAVPILEDWLVRLLTNYQSNSERQSNQITQTNAAVRCKCLLLLSSFRKWHWHLLQRQCQQKLIKHIHDSMSDSVPSVRAAACRAIGVLGTFVDPQTHQNFYTQSCALLLSKLRCALIKDAKDKSGEQSRVVVRASWAVANICDSQPFIFSTKHTQQSGNRSSDAPNPAKHKQANSTATANPLSESCIISVLRSVHRWDTIPKRVSLSTLLKANEIDDILTVSFALVTEHSSSKPEIACNAIRIVGNISSWIQITENEKQWTQICKCLSTELNREESKPKSKWNACCAAGNALSNLRIIQLTSHDSILATVSLFYALFRLIDTSPNFKIRITAASALCAPPTRRHYGYLFEQLFKASFALLRNVDSLSTTGYSQHKYKAILKSRLTALLFRMIDLCRMEDVSRPKIRSTLAKQWKFVHFTLITLQSQLDENNDGIVTTERSDAKHNDTTVSNNSKNKKSQNMNSNTHSPDLTLFTTSDIARMHQKCIDLFSHSVTYIEQHSSNDDESSVEQLRSFGIALGHFKTHSIK